MTRIDANEDDEKSSGIGRHRGQWRTATVTCLPSPLHSRPFASFAGISPLSVTRTWAACYPPSMSTIIVHPKESYAIIGACFAVYNEQGCGFTEDIYQECLELELADLGIPYVAQKELPLAYKGRRLKRKFKVDFLCYEMVVLEIKAVSHLTDEHRAQVQNYLHATGLDLGLLVNFGHYPKLENERIAMTTRKLQPRPLPDDFRL